MQNTHILLGSSIMIVVLLAGLIWTGWHIAEQHTAHTTAHTEVGNGDADTAHDHENTDSHTVDAATYSEAELTHAVLASIADGKYKCCLTEACTSCFVRHQNEDNYLLCDCLEDLVNGEAPCRSCVTGILAGEGNKYLAAYFASALSERMGEDEYPTLVALMTEHYDIPAEEQY